MRHDGGAPRLLGGGLEVVGEVGAEGRDAHRGAVAEGALAGELAASQWFPGHPHPDHHQQVVHGGTVPTPPVIALGKRGGQMVLIDLPALAEAGEDRQRHLRVVGVEPGRLGQSPLRHHPHGDVGVTEELLPKGVADGEAFKGRTGAFQWVRVPPSNRPRTRTRTR